MGYMQRCGICRLRIINKKNTGFCQCHLDNDKEMEKKELIIVKNN